MVWLLLDSVELVPFLPEKNSYRQSHRSLHKETMKFIQTGAVWSVEGEICMFTNNTLVHKVCTRTVASLGALSSEGKDNTASLGTEAGDSWSTSVSPRWHFGQRRGEGCEGPRDWGWLEYLLKSNSLNSTSDLPSLTLRLQIPKIQ